MPESTKLVYDCSDPGAAPVEVALGPEEIAARETVLAEYTQWQDAVEQAEADDAERLRLIQERGADDPAFAALAELMLRRKA